MLDIINCKALTRPAREDVLTYMINRPETEFFYG